jgi:8-oxo-dGTP diphosphatase
VLGDVAACRACPTIAPFRKFPATAAGRLDARFVLVGEAPGRLSLERGRQWTGTGGILLRREIRRLGLDLEDLFYLTNAVKCWPAAPAAGPRARAGNRSPRDSECRRCRPFLEAELAAVRPEVIVAVGARAARAVLGRPVRLPDDHGRRFLLDGAEVVVLLHPANASRHPRAWATYRASLLALFGELAARAGFPVVEVAAAVIRRGGRYLVTRRSLGKHLGGLWEFPGGKRQPGESLEACLARELEEELGVRARVGERLDLVAWAYPDRRVLLHFFRCELGPPRIQAREGQPHRWVTPTGLGRLSMPPADAALVARLVNGPATGRAAGTRGPRDPALRERPGGRGAAARSRRPSRRRRGGSPPGSPAR